MQQHISQRDNATTAFSSVEAPLDTPKSLASALSTTPQTVLNWFHSGVIPAKIAAGRIIRFNRSDVLEALAYRSRKGVTR